MGWTREQLNNAAIIAKVGRQVGASNRDIQIAIMAGIVESGLRNLNYGDRDSVGMFQQRDAWGSRSARLDPFQSARMFFLGGADGQRGLLDIHNRGSLSMGVAAQTVQVSAYPDRYAQHQSEAANILRSVGGTVVSTSGPKLNAYSQHLADQYAASHPEYQGYANAETQYGPKGFTGSVHLGEIPGLDQPSSTGRRGFTPQDVAPPSPITVNGIGEVTGDESGIGQVGFPGDASGGTDSPVDTPKFGVPLEDPMASIKMPTLGDIGGHTSVSTSFDGAGGPLPTGSSGGNKGVVGFAKQFLGTPYVWGGTQPGGFDCSGLVQYVYKKMGRNLPRLSADQARSGPRIKLGDLRPGDLVAWDNSSRNNGADHIAIYIGGGKIIEAPRPGRNVQISNLYDTGRAWGVRM